MIALPALAGWSLLHVGPLGVHRPRHAFRHTLTEGIELRSRIAPALATWDFAPRTDKRGLLEKVPFSL